MNGVKMTFTDLSEDLTSLNQAQVVPDYKSNEGLLSKIAARRKEITGVERMHPATKAAILRELIRFENWINQ